MALTLRADCHRRTLSFNHQKMKMAIGRAGACPAGSKREGDGRTPLGRYRIEYGFWRQDRLQRPDSRLHMKPISEALGWCDAPEDPRYNQLVQRPYPQSHEKLEREDSLYDICLVLSHNRWPVVPSYGSAIFLHIAKAENGALQPTEGCLAIERDDMLTLLPQLNSQSHVMIA